MAKVNVKKTMEKEIENGVDILIQRKSMKVKCSCFDELNKSGDSKCNICLGEGLLYKVQKERSIFQKNSPQSNSEIKQTNLGYINQSKFNLYLKANVKPSVNDKIFMASWQYDLPIELKRVLRIETVNPIIDNRGNTLLYDVQVKNDPKNFNIGKAIVKKTRDKKIRYGEGFYVRPL